MASRTHTMTDGTLTASAASILAGTAFGTDVLTGKVSVVLQNTAATTETVVLTFTRSGGTSRRIARAVLAQNEQMVVNGLPMQYDDTLLGQSTNASAVSYLVNAQAEGTFEIYVLDANGSRKNGAAHLSGPVTLTGDLTVTSDSGTSHVIWDSSAVPTLWANAPNEGRPDYHAIAHKFFDDFTNPASATASDLQAYTSTDDSGTGTNAFQDAAGGWYNVVTAGADNDYHAMSTVNEVFKFASGKKLWFEAKFKLTEANTNESAWWFGLTDTLTTGGLQADAAGPLASYDGALIWKDEATMAIDFETSNAGTQATTTNIATFVSGNETRVGFYFDGTATTSTITPYVDVDGNGFVAGTAQDITLAGLEEMHLVWGVKAGPSDGAETLQVDYIKCVQLR